SRRGRGRDRRGPHDRPRPVRAGGASGRRGCATRRSDRRSLSCADGCPGAARRWARSGTWCGMTGRGDAGELPEAMLTEVARLGAAAWRERKAAAEILRELVPRTDGDSLRLLAEHLLDGMLSSEAID